MERGGGRQVEERAGAPVGLKLLNKMEHEGYQTLVCTELRGFVRLTRVPRLGWFGDKRAKFQPLNPKQNN